ncbi:S-methyl-5-thioribose-1-phosphate isomerase [Mangrovimicrobium sediminis]|uniref:Methylthioribose-1-phosphate isomerase n=1 Tax=Mangrovimicrobium sediminis TaxID=2562682 RepID=A0A4Z0M003_9GAMM|nr:S-methyl-5-thioribose-1-phosphate isomerase [Haliea sp. SAOS-164]TGD72992.1 S-methyl-5-thioribose-1-phosphate isomerase [Haliea sp. SAOS-164]
MANDEALASLRWNVRDAAVEIIDQTLLPHTLHWLRLHTLDDYCHAISAMQVRGAPLIGITAAFGLAHALACDASDAALASARATLLATRPTAVNLRWALDVVAQAVAPLPPGQRAAAALDSAIALREAEIASCASIGDHGLAILQELARVLGCSAQRPLQVMTHCNAGRLATVHWGTALAPVYKAHAAGLPLHVWASETRPRNQGTHLTAWELQQAGVPCTVVADNSCGQLMRAGQVDCVIVGSDRTAANGDVCNKVGTYLKALAAADNGVPFYVALPASTVDWECACGAEIPIEERDAREVLWASGVDASGANQSVRLAAEPTRAANPAFDVTPARLVQGLITEHGVFAASPEGLARLRKALGAG